jgi:hypothetical protein
MATKPTLALLVKITLPFGRICAPEFFKPDSDILRIEFDTNSPSWEVISVGVSQTISPSQYSETDVDGSVGLISSISLIVPSTLGVRGSLGNKKVYLFASFETMRNNPYEYYSNID